MWKKNNFQSIYANRKLSLGYPELEQLGSKYKIEHQRDNRDIIDRIKTANDVINCYLRLVDIEQTSKKTLEIGCGPAPVFLKAMLARGLDARGLEPIKEMCKEAQNFILDEFRIIHGSAETIPLPDSSISFVVMNGVLEHVDSPSKTMDEIYRILEPGGVVFLSTTNKYLLHNDEYIKRFYQWYPSILKESYVFMHKHYRPELARYSSRPAVHWFCYSDLCKIGRNAGFYSFYSIIDLISENGTDYPNIGKFKRMLLPYLKYNSFIRSFSLTFLYGSSIFMIKRKE